MKERKSRSGRAPFAAAGVLVEGPKRVPVRRLNLIAGQRAEAQTAGARGFTLLADHLALAAGQTGEEVIETAVAPIFPVKLLGYSV